MVGGLQLFFALFNNIAIFIAMISLYSYLYSVLSKTRWYVRRIVTGLCFGVFAVGCMYAKIPVFEGVIVDQRNAIVALSGAFGGPVAAFISAEMAGAYRAYLGGGGVLAGVIGVNLAATAGTLLYFWKGSFKTMPKAFIRSIIAVIIILPGFLFVGTLKTGFELMMDMGLPYGLAILTGILFGGLLLNREEHRLQVEKSLIISEKKYRLLFETFPLGVTVTNNNGEIIETNKMAEKILKVPKNEHESRFLDSSSWKILNPDGSTMDPSQIPGVIALAKNQVISDSEIGIVGPDQRTTWLSVTAAPIPLEDYGVAIAFNNITTRKDSEDKLKKTLSEKTVLLQELYHRTKNNMQLIIALLDSQSHYINSKTIKNILQEVENRIHSMALVHQKLYQSRDLSHVNLPDYIKELIEWMLDSYQLSEDQIQVNYEMEDVFLKIDTAIPCGLIIQEIISNAFKHAFPSGKNGILDIKLKTSPDKDIILSIKDNGKINDPDLDVRKKGKFGIKTITALAEEQLRGKLDFDASNGLTCSFIFRDNLYDERVSK